MDDDDSALSAQLLQHAHALAADCLCVDTAAFLVAISTIRSFGGRQVAKFQWHLTNIATTVYLADLCVSFLFVPLPVFPIWGFCSVSWVGEIVADWIGERWTLKGVVRPKLPDWTAVSKKRPVAVSTPNSIMSTQRRNHSPLPQKVKAEKFGQMDSSFYPLDSPNVLSDDSIRLYFFFSVFCVILDSAAFIISMIAVLFFTKQSFRRFRWNLLNISVSVYSADLMGNLFFTPLPLFPVWGFCSVSGVGQWLAGRIGDRLALKVDVAIQLFTLGASMAAVSNATLHRYLASRSLDRTEQEVSRRWVPTLLAFQFFWPLFVGLLIATVEPITPAARELYERIHPDILRRTQGRPCLLVDPATVLEDNPVFVFGFALLLLSGVYIFGGTAIYAWLCWRALSRLNLSERAYRMRKQLMVSLILQSFLPAAAMGTGAALMLVMAVTKPQRFLLIHSFCYLVFGMHSVLNCAAMVLSIPPYRHGILSALKLGRVRKSNGETSVVSGQQSTRHERKRWAWRIGRSAVDAS